MKLEINKKKVMLFLIDFAVILLANLFSFTFFMNLSDFGQIKEVLICFWVTLSVGSMAGLLIFHAYRGILRFAALMDFVRVACGIIFGAFLSEIAALLYFFKISSIENGYEDFRKLVIITIFSILMVLFCVMSVRGAYCVFVYIKGRIKRKSDKKRTLIVGAGATCRIILGEMNNTTSIYDPVCIVDDDSTKISRFFQDIPVYGPTVMIPEICEKHDIEIIVFAIPSCDEEDKKRILHICKDTGKEVLVLPDISKLILHSNEMSLIKQVKKLKMEDLLGRETIRFDKDEVRRLIEGKVCMVTGGGGSIGSELCRQIARNNPKRLVIVDIYENNAYDIQQELRGEYNGKLNFETRIASVRDYPKMSKLFAEFRPDIVFHAAAHKHVPLMEDSPEEAVKNNVFGTFNCAMLADFYKTQKFVLISTDKAVNPTNVMGATKRICEMIVQYMAQTSAYTEFAAVRFGNVLGSNGSVIPLFRNQIEKGGPVTVTHPDIIRYFMTIPEAVSLVLQAGKMAKGSEIFVLDMGEPVKITTLAENLIRIYGYEPNVDMKIEFTGLRPGEKLFEELLMDEEGLKKTGHDKIFVGNQIKIEPDMLIKQLEELKELANTNKTQEVIDKIEQIVPTFHHKLNKKKVEAVK